MCVTMPAIDKEGLLAEICRLLDQGEPLLSVFPKDLPDPFILKLPETISDEMWGYANDVSARSWAPEEFLEVWGRVENYQLEQEVKDLEAGLLGWRAVGVIR